MNTDFSRMNCRSRGNETQIKGEKLETPHVVSYELKAAFHAHFETKRDGFLDVFQRLGLGLALADATGNRRALGHPDSILVAVNRNGKFHA